MYVLYQDKLVLREDANKINIEDRGYQFGDGVYEGIRIYNGKPFTVSEHLDRLFSSAEQIKLIIPYTKEKLTVLIKQLVEANQLITGIVYFQISRGIQSPRNHIFLDHPEVTPILTGFTQDIPIDYEGLEKGSKGITVADTRWLHCNIKSLNLLVNVLANNEASAVGANEAIFHREGIVTECSHSNLFIVRNGALWTHPANNLVLNGITRQTILKKAKKIGIPTIESTFTVADLLKADEVFYTNIASEAYPLVQIDNQLIGSGKIGPITKKAQQFIFEAAQAECGIIH